MRITASVLEELAERRHFAKRTLEIAKRLLIEGETPTHLALGYAVSVQRIYRIRDSVLAAARAKELPKGWEEVTIAAPRPVIRKIRKRLAEAGDTYRVAPKSRRENPNLKLH